MLMDFLFLDLNVLDFDLFCMLRVHVRVRVRVPLPPFSLELSLLQLLLLCKIDVLLSKSLLVLLPIIIFESSVDDFLLETLNCDLFHKKCK